MVVRLCRVDATPPCGWSGHHFKHFPFEGMTRRATLHGNPARYLSDFDATRIAALEVETVQRADRRAEPTQSKTKYLREMPEPIGWDLGQDAVFSLSSVPDQFAGARHGFVNGAARPRNRATTLRERCMTYDILIVPQQLLRIRFLDVARNERDMVALTCAYVPAQGADGARRGRDRHRSGHAESCRAVLL
jgi:hypothetical protein